MRRAHLVAVLVAGVAGGAPVGVLGLRRARPLASTRFVLGFSNGAYFALLLATQGLLEASAFTIAHGGPVEPVRATRGTPPLLLLSADDDIAQDDMIRLEVELAREHWPHDDYARAGVHGLTDQDIDAALTFFGRARADAPRSAAPVPSTRPRARGGPPVRPVSSLPSEAQCHICFAGRATRQAGERGSWPPHRAAPFLLPKEPDVRGPRK